MNHPRFQTHNDSLFEQLSPFIVATPGALGVEGRHAREAVLGLLQPHVHGAHEHAVLEGGKAQVQGREHVGKGGHGGSLKKVG